MKFLSAVVFLFIFNFFEQLLAQQFYRWVDDNGIVHFADSPHSVPERYRRVLEIALTDRGGSGLGILGMDSLDGFRVDIDHRSNWMDMVREDGPYGGHSPEWWQEKFRFYRELKQTYENILRGTGRFCGNTPINRS